MKNLILLLSLFILSKDAYTQNITFVNTENNTPIAEVNIISKTNANLGVISDSKGNASLDIFSFEDTLIAMHIGFNNKEIINNLLNKKSSIKNIIKLIPKLYNNHQNERLSKALKLSFLLAPLPLSNPFPPLKNRS